MRGAHLQASSFITFQTPYPPTPPHHPPPRAWQVNFACGVPAGLRFFPATLAFDNLTACSYDATAYGNWSTNWASIAGGPSWVDNQYGAK